MRVVAATAAKHKRPLEARAVNKRYEEWSDSQRDSSECFSSVAGMRAKASSCLSRAERASGGGPASRQTHT
jgi:hypothetical protein